MKPNWNDSEPTWIQEKSLKSMVSAPSTTNGMPSSSGWRASTASTGQLGLRATTASTNILAYSRVHGVVNTPTMASSSKRGDRRIRGSHSAQGLATVGLGNFKIGALHDVMKQGDLVVDHEHEHDNCGFFPGGLGVPDSFKSLDPEENRPPPELFAWGQQRSASNKILDDRHPETASPDPASPARRTSSLEVATQECNKGLPGIRRSATAAVGRVGTAAIGLKRKALATTGGEGIGLAGPRGGGGNRRRSSAEGGITFGRRQKFSAVRGTDGTWQFIARVKHVRETPVSRGDAYSLVEEFESAMAIMGKQKDGAEGRVEAFTSPMQNDMHALQHEVGRNFGARAAVVEAVQIMERGGEVRVDRRSLSRDGEVDSEQGHDADDINTRTGESVEEDASMHSLTGEWVRSAVGLGPEDWAAYQHTLGECIFEQKWLDLTCGELCDQVSVLCLPHGQLLREMRRRNASVFNRVHGLYSDCLWVLNECVASVLEGRRERRKAEEEWTLRLHNTCAEYEAQIKVIRDSRGSEKQEQARAKKEARAQVDRMGDTLRTLNGIFKTMQADGKAMTEADLKDRCRSLEQELAAKREEVHELRGLKEKNLKTQAEMQELRLELLTAKHEGAKLKEEMDRRQSLVRELMDNEAKRLTEIEALKAGSDSIYAGHNDDDEGEERENDLPRAGSRGSGSKKNKQKRKQKYRKQNSRSQRSAGAGNTGEKSSDAGGGEDVTKGGGDGTKAENGEEEEEEEDEEEVASSVLCIRCRKALDDLSNIADALEKERQIKGQTRLQCHAYRLLLPNLKGHRPPRTVVWVRTVMRAILRAKIWDDSVLRYKQDLRVRFPEFAYSWLEPPREEMADTNAIGRSKLVGEADDDRWGLYYGVKTLARESAEATIFWHLLNETNGEDYLTFLLYCLAIVEGTVGSMLRDQWGVSATCTDLHTLKQKIKEGQSSQAAQVVQPSADVAASKGEGDQDLPEPLSSGRDVVWLLLTDAVETVDHVLLKALKDQKRKVLDATKIISVSCEGRLPGHDSSSMCVDLFLFLRIMLHSFKEEQVNRRAAVRLMFETAATGVLTDGTPIYGDGRVDQSALAAAETVYSSLLNESKATVDLPQFMAIARTLWPEVTTADAVAVFRDAHEETSGEVDYQAFLRLADRWQFFSNALQLPVHMPSRADLGEGLDIATRNHLGALVHRHYSLMRPVLETVKNSLPESAVKQLVKCQRAVDRELKDAGRPSMASRLANATAMADAGKATQENSSSEGGGTQGTTSEGVGESSEQSTGRHKVMPATCMDGTRPLAAYRRLLAMLYHIRNIRHESGPGFVMPPLRRAGSNTVVQKTEGEFRALEKVFFDLQVDPRFTTYERIRNRLAAIRIQRTWRKKLALSCEVPLGVLRLMRSGYLRGAGGIVSRRVHHQPCWTQQQVAETYTAKLRADSQVTRSGLPTLGAASGLSRRDLSWVTFNRLLRQWGTPALAERAAHDLFFNVRSLAPSLSRLRLFGAFTGCFPPERAGSSFERDVELRDEEALAFYLRAVVMFHHVREEAERNRGGKENGDEGAGNGAADGDDELKKYLASLGGGGSSSTNSGGEMNSVLDIGAIMGDGSKVIEELFPVTVQDPRTGRQHWHESASVAAAVSKTLFERCSQPPPVETKSGGGGSSVPTARARVSQVQMSFGKMMGHPVLTGGRKGEVDVDDVLWLFMKHWLVVRRHRQSMLDRALGLAAPPAFANPAMTDSRAEDAARNSSPLLSVDAFGVVMATFEKLSGSAPPRGVSDLVYGDAYIVALGLYRQSEPKTVSQHEAAKSALCASPVLLWDVSGDRQARGAPPTFSTRASRSCLLAAWARYEKPLKAQLPVLMQELRDKVENVVLSAVAVDDPSETIATATEAVSQAESSAVIGQGTDLISSPSDAELKQLTRTLEKAQAENERLKHYMKGLAMYHKQSMAGSAANGEQLTPEMVTKYKRVGEMDRAGKEMRSLLTVLSSVYRRMRPRDPQDFIADAWTSGKRTSLRHSSFNSY